ncbi:MAG: Coenzyme F420 hydrogenase/dehydrogenase, beta subunit C-terminal domain [Intestinibacter sp.]|uniref:Coenzyme F420 hydrogenase/dehydrogenase, beta subunit C-terminal domain n=1 Tax=Intestinibacter sp. TaxID=1965304 RepID=UPI003F15C642
MNICDKSKCTACYTCYNICPKNCISFENDEYGIKFPVIDDTKCIECNLCVKTCPANNESNFNKPKNAYATWSLDNEDRKTSTSGGLASVLYNEVISKNGVVYGVCMDENFNLNFERATHKNDLYKFKGSKYVQASVNDKFKLVKDDLENNKNVLFIGTPCQIDGLKFYLKKEYSNLYTVDLICHGTPPIGYLKEYIEKIINEKNINPSKILFREDNEYAFILCKDSTQNKLYYKSGFCDEYIQGFLNSLFYRECCYSCKYATNQRVSDMTIGDFWGLGLKEPFNHPYTGAISLALVNTSKGQELLYKCKDKLFMEERSVEEAIEGNAQLNYPSNRHKNYDAFREKYKQYGFVKAANQCLTEELRIGYKKYRKILIRKKLRNMAGIFIKKYRD